MVLVLVPLALVGWVQAVSAADGGRPFATTLSGAAEVPGRGDPDGSGTATLTVNPGRGEICFTLTVAGVAPSTAAHIHVGAAGVAGPVVVPLVPPTSGTSSACASGRPRARARHHPEPRELLRERAQRRVPGGRASRTALPLTVKSRSLREVGGRPPRPGQSSGVTGRGESVRVNRTLRPDTAAVTSAIRALRKRRHRVRPLVVPMHDFNCVERGRAPGARPTQERMRGWRRRLLARRSGSPAADRRGSSLHSRRLLPRAVIIGQLCCWSGSISRSR